MKIAFFDCFSGASGDMILGALVDAGLEIELLRAELAKLPLEGYEVSSQPTSKKQISGTRVIVEAADTKTHRHYPDIVRIIEASGLTASAKQSSIDVFTNLARAEAKIHSTTVEKIHFHEVGAIDAIIDIAGAVVGLELLGVEQIFASRLHVGTGFVDCQHGRMPVPAPATMELLRDVPVYSSGIEAELVTPTGAAILKTLATSFGPAPQMTITATGYGAGSRDLEIPNLLRLWLGEVDDNRLDEDEVVLIETNVDNMNPELLADAVESLQRNGVLDVFQTPILMKKNRAATKLSLLVRPEDMEKTTAHLFASVATMGVRYQKLRRRKLHREIIKVSTEFGKVDVKIGRSAGSVMSINPEYESCRRLAAESGASIREVFAAALAATRKTAT